MAKQAKDGADWLHDGRTYDAQRYSPLTQINASNVSKLGIAWYDELDTFRGVEATPLYADGVIYNTMPWNITMAYDARTGKRLWTYDPKVPREYGRYACCEPVARGLALWKGKVIIATLDGRVIALDAKSGTPVWTTEAFDHSMPYSITGAPRVFDGKVVIGESGGDLGVRGFVIAFDAETGKKLWKFFLTPNPEGKPDGEASDSILAMIRKTGTTMACGRPWAAAPIPGIRSPTTRSSIWFTSAPAMAARTAGIIARAARATISSSARSSRSMRPRAGTSGHYQEVPEEDWDYTCTSTITLADLPIAGKARRVVMHAPKNGYFYVLDAASGKFISAKPYVPVNWGTVDPKTGKATVAPGKHYGTSPELLIPGPGGGHNWFPMAYSPRTKLAYFPTFESGFAYAYDPNWTPKPFRSNSGWGGYTGTRSRSVPNIRSRSMRWRRPFWSHGIRQAGGGLARAAAASWQWRRHGDGQRSRLRGHHQADLRRLRRE